MNPQGEARRWDVYPNIIPPANQSEISVMKDLDGDGKPELIYGSAGAVRLAKPDPAHPTGPRLSTQVGEAGSYTGHGIGAGDINGDGRQDVLNPTGWWEQPPEGVQPPMWKHHPTPFGRGGAEMAVYDVNGDGLNDVVTSMQAHGFGLSWFEHTRDAAGAISFVEHEIYVRGKGRRAMTVYADVARRAEVEPMIDQVWSTLGPVDILVNNAGIETIVPFLELTDEQWTRLTDVNLRGNAEALAVVGHPTCPVRPQSDSLTRHLTITRTTCAAANDLVTVLCEYTTMS